MKDENKASELDFRLYIGAVIILLIATIFLTAKVNQKNIKDQKEYYENVIDSLQMDCHRKVTTLKTMRYRDSVEFNKRFSALCAPVFR